MVTPIILNRQRKHPLSVQRLQRFALRLSQRLKTSEGEFTALLTNDRRIRLLNRTFLHKDNATDVLSFPSQDHPAGLRFDNTYLGDMMISVESASRQARAQHHSLETEIKVLMIHGLLHLLGYDHETDEGQMRRKELKLRKDLL